MNAVVGCTLLTGGIFVALNLLCDLLYRIFDPPHATGGAMTDSIKSLRIRPRQWAARRLSDLAPQTPLQARVQLGWIQWRRFCANHSALFGLLVLLIIVAAAIFSPWLANHDIYAQNLGVAPATAGRRTLARHG